MRSSRIFRCVAVPAVIAVCAMAAPRQSAALGECAAQAVSTGRPGPAPATTGAAFARQLRSLGDDDREATIRRALLQGRFPPFLSHLRPVAFRGRASSGSDREITVCVMPDYLSVGSDRDFIRVPMGLPTALEVADSLGLMLPTAKIVDAVYRQADVRLTPRPLPPGPAMRSGDYIWRHEQIIRGQLGDLRAASGLTAGHKKDLTLTGRLWNKLHRVAIYGWHRANGKPIQPLSTVHGERYADYSHGVRLVAKTAFVNGEQRSLVDILGDAELAPLVSYEGAVRNLPALIRRLRGTSAGVKPASAGTTG